MTPPRRIRCSAPLLPRKPSVTLPNPPCPPHPRPQIDEEIKLHMGLASTSDAGMEEDDADTNEAERPALLDLDMHAMQQR